MNRTMMSIVLALAVLAPAEVKAAILNIEDFGARADDRQEDALAISRAIRAANAGDSVYVPAGRYDVGSTIAMKSGVDVVGSGCGRSVLRRVGSRSGQIMFRLDGVRGMEVRGLQFEYAGAPEYYRAIGFRGRGSDNIAISNNCFLEADFQGGRGDRWAVELSATQSPSSNIYIANNQVRGNVQLTAGGGAGLQGAVVRDNRVSDARANGIAMSTLSDTARFSDIIIRDNVIENSSAIGIFIGPDKPEAGGGRFERIEITGNRISGLRNRFSYGIFVRAPERGMSDLIIRNNTIDGSGSAKAIAIRLLDDHGRGRRSFSDVRICSNIARNVSRGIWLQRVFGGVVTKNAMSTNRPYEALPDQNDEILLSGRC